MEPKIFLLLLQNFMAIQIVVLVVLTSNSQVYIKNFLKKTCFLDKKV